VPRWLAPAALTVAAVVFAGLGFTHVPGGRAPGAATASVPTATPVLSVRRVPTAVAGVVADEHLAQRLTATLADPLLAGTQACLEVRVGGAPVYSRNATAPLLPASNLKLLTAYAALTRLGPDARLATTVVAPRRPAGGVVDGPLFLVGGGDPLLATAAYRPSQTEWTASREPVTRLEDLAARIKAAGITRVTGGVVGDDSRYDAERTVPTWKASYLALGEIGPVGALEVNGGFAIAGRRKTAVADPAQAAAAALSTLLQARGIGVGAPPTSGTAPPGAAPVASIESLPVREIVGEMTRESDNLAAEMLTKELGHRFGGTGSWAAGTRVVRDTLAGAGLPLEGFTQVDGSGLDRSDRASCHTLAMGASGRAPVGAELAGALPRAGSCGTLVKRLVGQPAAGRVRAKTGSLTGVAALTGYVDPAPPAVPPRCPPTPGPADARPAAAVTFSLLANDVTTDGAGTTIEDRVANALASYPEAPPLAALGPVGS